MLRLGLGWTEVRKNNLNSLELEKSNSPTAAATLKTKIQRKEKEEK